MELRSGYSNLVFHRGWVKVRAVLVSHAMIGDSRDKEKREIGRIVRGVDMSVHDDQFRTYLHQKVK